MSVATAQQGNLSAEHAIDNDEINRGQAHAERPPDQTDLKCVRP